MWIEKNLMKIGLKILTFIDKKCLLIRHGCSRRGHSAMSERTCVILSLFWSLSHVDCSNIDGDMAENINCEVKSNLPFNPISAL